MRCGYDTSYIVSVHIQCQASIYTLLLCWGHSWRVRLAKQETPTPPGHLVSPLVYRGLWMSTVVFYCWCHSDSASVFLYFTIPYTLVSEGHVCLKEQDKLSDIEQQPPFGDRKYSKTLPQERGGDTKSTGTSYNLDKVFSDASNVCFRKSSSGMLIILTKTNSCHSKIITLNN